MFQHGNCPVFALHHLGKQRQTNADDFTLFCQTCDYLFEEVLLLLGDFAYLIGQALSITWTGQEFQKEVGIVGVKRPSRKQFRLPRSRRRWHLFLPSPKARGNHPWARGGRRSAARSSHRLRLRGKRGNHRLRLRGKQSSRCLRKAAIKHFCISAAERGHEPLDSFGKIGHTVISSLRGRLARDSSAVT